MDKILTKNFNSYTNCIFEKQSTIPILTSAWSVLYILVIRKHVDLEQTQLLNLP